MIGSLEFATYSVTFIPQPSKEEASGFPI